MVGRNAWYSIAQVVFVNKVVESAGPICDPDKRVNELENEWGESHRLSPPKLPFLPDEPAGGLSHYSTTPLLQHSTSPASPSRPKPGASSVPPLHLRPLPRRRRRVAALVVVVDRGGAVVVQVVDVVAEQET